MNEQRDVNYLQGIAENDYPTLNRIYQESLPEVIKYIRKNSGSADDARDVFQEAILVIFRKVKDQKLVLTTTFHQYLFTVCRRMWLAKLKKKKRAPLTSAKEEDFAFEEQYEEAFLKTRKWRLFNQKFAQLSEECQRVLKMMFNGLSNKEIAQKTGYSEEYAKRKRYRCKGTLSELIKNDPEYFPIKKAESDGP